MIIKTRVCGYAIPQMLVDPKTEEELINKMCKEAFEEALKKIETNKDMFSYEMIFDKKKHLFEISVDCEFSVDNVKKE